MEHKNVDCKEEHHSNRDAAVEDQNTGERIQDHTEQAGYKGNYDQDQQQPALPAQFLSIDNGMEDTQQQEKNGCQLVNMDPSQGGP